MNHQPSHDDILEAIKGIESQIAPLAAITPQLKSMAEIYTAGKVGGSFIKWLAGIGGLLIAAWAFIKAVAATIGGS